MIMSFVYIIRRFSPYQKKQCVITNLAPDLIDESTEFSPTMKNPVISAVLNNG